MKKYRMLVLLCVLVMVGFTSHQTRPPKILDVDFGTGNGPFEARKWCITDDDYIRLVKRDTELNFIIDRYEEILKEVER